MGGREEDFLRLRRLCPGDGVRGRHPKPGWDEDAAVVGVIATQRGCEPGGGLGDGVGGPVGFQGCCLQSPACTRTRDSQRRAMGGEDRDGDQAWGPNVRIAHRVQAS